MVPPLSQVSIVLEFDCEISVLHRCYECLNQSWFTSLEDARRIIEAWRMDYNTGAYSHSSLGYRTPEEGRRPKSPRPASPPPTPVGVANPKMNRSLILRHFPLQLCLRLEQRKQHQGQLPDRFQHQLITSQFEFTIVGRMLSNSMERPTFPKGRGSR